MSVFIARRNGEWSWEIEDVIPQWIKQRNLYVQKVLEGWTVKGENLVRYNIFLNINYLQSNNTQTFPLLH